MTPLRGCRIFKPRYTLTPPIAKALMEIEACRRAIICVPLSAPMLRSLRNTARLHSAHFSTQIEGNRLSLSQVEGVRKGGGGFPGRERDEAEVRNYFLALDFVLAEGRRNRRLTEQHLHTINGLVLRGRSEATNYRKGQNAGRSGIVYSPPAAKHVPLLMSELMAWIVEQMRRHELPVPMIAAIAHYQFATIHPYNDGNGRTACLLALLILHCGGHGLHGIYSLEEYYARNLAGYYEAFAVGESNDYSKGRAEADITDFLDFYCRGMSDTFAGLRASAEEAKRRGDQDQAAALHEMPAEERKARPLFARTSTVSARDVAEFFGISTRKASMLCAKWTEKGFLVIADTSKKNRTYRLVEKYDGALPSADREPKP